MSLNQQLGLRLADEGMASAMGNEPEYWRECAMLELREYATRHKTFTLEQFRASWRMAGHPEPHHVNVWGALAKRAVAEDVIKWTGNFKLAASPAAHGRPVRIWRSTV